MNDRRPPTLEEFRRQMLDQISAEQNRRAEQILKHGLPGRRPRVKPKACAPREFTPLLPGIAIQCYSRRKN